MFCTLPEGKVYIFANQGGLFGPVTIKDMQTPTPLRSGQILFSIRFRTFEDIKKIQFFFVRKKKKLCAYVSDDFRKFFFA